MWQSTARSVRAGWSRTCSNGCAFLLFLGFALTTDSKAQTSVQPTGELQIGQHVGLFELEAPDTSVIMLRGTLPVPKGAYHPGQHKVPFAVLGLDGTTVETQVEAVTRYPKWEDGADVVEIIASVAIPPGTIPGARLSFPIVYRPHLPHDLLVSPDIFALPTEPGQLIVKAWDYFGNCYAADLAVNDTTTFIQRGQLTQVFRTHVTLMPVNPVANGGANDTLPHLMGVHAYFRLRSREPFVEVTLRVHNGHSGHDALDPSDDALGDIYFKRMELSVPSHYTVLQDFEDPQSGAFGPTAHPDDFWIVSGSADFPVHFMPKQAQFIRRYAIARDLKTERAQLYLDAHDMAFARPADDPVSGEPLWSWSNPETSAYFTQDITVPKLNHLTPEQHRLGLTDKLDHLRTKVLEGSGGGYPVHSPRLGWAHPWGYKHGGIAGGTEIYQYDGLRTIAGASREGLLWLRLRLQMLTDRNPVTLYNKDGEISRVEDWLENGQNGPYLNCWYFLRPILDGTQQDPFGFTTSPSHQRDFIESNGFQPPYKNELFGYHPNDFQHYTRYNAPAKALVWISNDPVIKDQLRMQAEAYRLSYNMYDNTSFGLYIGTGQKYDHVYAADHPGTGIGIGRGEGWGAESMTAVYAFESREWREQMLPWFTETVETVSAGQAHCSGIIHAQVQSQGFNGQYRGKQNTEQVIVENALIGMRETIYRDVEPDRVETINEVLLASFRGGVLTPAWSNTLAGPWGRLAVSGTDPDDPLFCAQLPSDGQAPWRDNHQSWSSLGFGYKMTGLPIYLERAEQMSASGPGAANLLDRLLVADELNWENQAVLLEILERIVSGG